MCTVKYVLIVDISAHACMFQVVHTNPHQPSLSVVRRICYSEEYKFTSKATQYGCENERDARETYKVAMAHHVGFSTQPCGFFVDQEIPYLGASSDGLVHCNCCRYGVLEVKCPHCAQMLKCGHCRGKKNLLSTEDPIWIPVAVKGSSLLCTMSVAATCHQT